MIDGCQRRGACWTHTDSPGFVRGPRLRGYSVTRRPGSYGLTGVKKNGVRLLRHKAPEFLRPQGTPYSGPVLWGHANLSGGGGPQGPVSEVRQGEAGEVSVACGQPFLHEAVCLVCGTAVQGDHGQGHGKGAQAGLEDGQGPGQGVHAGAAPTYGNPRTQGNRH